MIRPGKIKSFTHDGAALKFLFELYRDDGRTYAYERGDFTLATLTWDDAAGTIRIEGDSEGLFARPQAEWLKRIG